MIVTLDKFDKACRQVIVSHSKCRLYLDYLRSRIFDNSDTETATQRDIDEDLISHLTDLYIKYCNPTWDVKKVGDLINEQLFKESKP